MDVDLIIEIKQKNLKSAAPGEDDFKKRTYSPPRLVSLSDNLSINSGNSSPIRENSSGEFSVS